MEEIGLTIGGASRDCAREGAPRGQPRALRRRSRSRYFWIIPDAVLGARRAPGRPFELRMGEVGDMIVNFVKMPAGADFAPAFAGLPDDRCQVPHYGDRAQGAGLYGQRRG